MTKGVVKALNWIGLSDAHAVSGSRTLGEAAAPRSSLTDLASL
jgi:hypothetical protein